MAKVSKNAATNTAEQPGLVVPIDVEALCIGKDPGAIFESVPYSFELLKNPPYLSSAIAAGGLTSLPQGVHLHWAIPDAISKGQDGDSGVLFPAVPDRWLVTRIYCDSEQAGPPQFSRWVIESNYFADDDPNADSSRASVTAPYQGTDWESQPWRHLGKVSTYEDWIQQQSAFQAGSVESYVAGLSAVGWGQAEFAASYPNCQNILGFNDLGADLEALGTNADKNVSYHIIGWYSNPADDPLRQLPASIPQATFNELLANITDSSDKTFVTASFVATSYVLVSNVSASDGERLWSILDAAGYQLEVDIPDSITTTDLAQVLANISDANDKSFLEASYPPDFGPTDSLSDDDKTRLWDILAGAGYDFLGTLLTEAKWAIPSRAVAPATPPSFTLYSGLITDVIWNGTTDYFSSKPGDDFNIAIGNTPGQALSALIANTSGLPADQAAEVEEILDALQAGILDQVTDESMLADWEALKASLHATSFGSTLGGFLWEVKKAQFSADDNTEATLPATLAKDLNDLNIKQQQYNDAEAQITSMRSQIFADWYKFMFALYPGHDNPMSGIEPSDLASYIQLGIIDGLLSPLVTQTDSLGTEISGLVNDLRIELGDTYFLSKISAPRYWQPSDPALLFEGNGIEPSDRFGSDGRYMYDDTLLCRLSTECLSSLTIPAGALGNTDALTLGASDFPTITHVNGESLADALNVVVTDAALLNQDVIAALLRNGSVTTAFATLTKQIQPLIAAFLSPTLPQTIDLAAFQSTENEISDADKTFLESWYVLDNTNYVLQNPSTLTNSDTLRLRYIFNSVALNPSASELAYSGLPFSEVGIQTWNGNPWLPFSLKWTVYYYPLQDIENGGSGYPTDFVTSNFEIGDTNLDYTGPAVSPDQANFEEYSNTIFLTPHANINLQKQLTSFIEAHPDDPIKDELNSIVPLLDNKPVLAQALSGYNESLTMRQKEMQLPVSDPAATGAFYKFTNTVVNQAVQEQNEDMPLLGAGYNPIRVGLMKIASITLVDVFGQNVTVDQPAKVIRAQNMQQTVLTPEIDIYLPPRLSEASRLHFRWLSADDDTVEMNSHPAATPICGWVLANHLDSSLWIYDNKGNPYGSLILNSDNSKILWQSMPGGAYFGDTIQEFFTKLGDANPHLTSFVLALYGSGDQASAAYLDAFMRALDDASVTIDPANNQQYQANAVLIGRPLALVRAAIDLKLMGEPCYNQSKLDLKNQVDEYSNQGTINPGNDYGFTNVEFPVKIGNIPQTDDGLVGYFKEEDYSTFYAPAVTQATANVKPPGNNNLVVTCADTTPQTVSLLIEPRGKVHASTGILPVKSIEIPPDQYVDALQRLQLSFLTSPVLTSRAKFAIPVPAQQGGHWEWVENHDTSWSATPQIAKVTTDAVMDYAPQQILEGWLNLSSRLFTGNDFSLVNKSAGDAVLYISTDPTLNVMTITFTNLTGLPLQLQGGAPVNGSYQTGGSSFVFNFGSMLPDSILKAMTVSATGWLAQYFSGSSGTPGVWSVAPDSDVTLSENDSIAITLNQVTCPAGTNPGNFQISYFNLLTVPDSLAPVLIGVAVSQPPI